MRNIKISSKISLTMLFFIPVLALAQAFESGSIDDQFKNLTEKSNNYQDYKVVKKTELQKLWKNTSDTIKAKQNAYNKTANLLSAKDKTIAKLNGDLEKKDKELNAAINSVNEISLLGFIPLPKQTYNVMMCTIILLLIAIAAFLYFRSVYSNNQARQKTSLYEEISEEYRAFKTKSHENEKRLARELQDERNKLAEHNIL